MKFYLHPVMAIWTLRDAFAYYSPLPSILTLQENYLLPLSFKAGWIALTLKPSLDQEFFFPIPGRVLRQLAINH